jgi:SAM-dependent methyltransferase
MDADAWDGCYRTGSFRGMWDYRFPSQELVGTLAALGLPRGANALDAGCGAGTEAVYLASLGYHVSGVDWSATALSIAADRALRAGVRVRWRVGSVLDLPLPDGAFDFVNDRGCFHHVAEADRPAYAREVGRVLRPGGRLLIRGCRAAGGPAPFVPVTQEAVDRFFPAPAFSRGPVLPVSLNSDTGHLQANMVLITRR